MITHLAQEVKQLERMDNKPNTCSLRFFHRKGISCHEKGKGERTRLGKGGAFQREIPLEGEAASEPK